jgi:biotin operon repressor
MNKTDRLLAIVLKLQSSGGMRAEDLAAFFETSKRTIYRDIQALSEAGVPVVATPGQYLYEPDGAVIRAGLVEELAQQIGAVKLDEDIAFLTSDELVPTPFARPFKILESLTFNLKKLNQRLNKLGVGRVVVKKRGSPLDPQELEHTLKLKGPREVEKIVVLTQVRGTHTALICEATSSGATSSGLVNHEQD